MSKRHPKPDRNEDGRARRQGRTQYRTVGCSSPAKTWRRWPLALSSPLGKKGRELSGKRKEAEKKKKKRNARSGPSWAGKERRAQFFFYRRCVLMGEKNSPKL
jgi:hypothetical protein